jgi:septal ring factor EnvC (AmiA/AmiB activator)
LQQITCTLAKKKKKKIARQRTESKERERESEKARKIRAACRPKKKRIEKKNPLPLHSTKCFPPQILFLMF